MVRPAEHRRDPGVRRHARELRVRVAGSLEDDGRRSCALCRSQSIAAASPASRLRERAAGVERERAVLLPEARDRDVERPQRREQRADGQDGALRPVPAAAGGEGAPGEDHAPDRDERPRLVVELEDRVHPLQVGPVAVLEVDELASADHPEAEHQQERGEHSGAVVARGAQARPGRPRGEQSQKDDDGHGGHLEHEAGDERRRTGQRPGRGRGGAAPLPNRPRSAARARARRRRRGFPTRRRTRSGRRTSSCGPRPLLSSTKEDV